MPKLVAMLRVRDGGLFVSEWLAVMEKLVDEIVVVDNGSTDGTVALLRAHPKVVDLAVTEGFNEGRDKILVYEMARKRAPDWCIWLDIDEIFEKRLNRRVLETMMGSSSITRYHFRRYDFKGDYAHFFMGFTNLNHTFGYSRTMWKEQPQAYFKDLPIHNGDIQGVRGKRALSKYRLKHLGYVDPRHVVAKTDKYIEVDPARRKMYLEHYEKKPGMTLRWREFNESPVMVTAQGLLYDLVFFGLAVGSRIRRLTGKSKNENGTR